MQPSWIQVSGRVTFCPQNEYFIDLTDVGLTHSKFQGADTSRWGEACPLCFTQKSWCVHTSNWKCNWLRHIKADFKIIYYHANPTEIIALQDQKYVAGVLPDTLGSLRLIGRTISISLCSLPLFLLNWFGGTFSRVEDGIWERRSVVGQPGRDTWHTELDLTSWYGAQKYPLLILQTAPMFWLI